jgi:hypothetical protein
LYIDSIRLRNFRTFRETEIKFCHPDVDFANRGLPKPSLPNVNLILGNNGFGKTTLLKGIALAALGPAVADAGIFPYRLVRDELANAKIEAQFVSHAQDHAPAPLLESNLVVIRKGDLEKLQWTHRDEKPWHPIYDSRTDAFFFVGYGATRRVEQKRNLDPASRRASSFARAQRVQSLFEESYSLVPLNAWLPEWKTRNPGRYKQVVTLLNELTGKEHYRFTGERNREGEYLFERGRMKVPFPALSDGYRAYLGWIGDLLYHVCFTTPSGKRLDENRGLVMVDEIDLHLHPQWQMSVVERIAKTLKNIQFIVTSHSPLVVGSLEWMNIIVMEPGPSESSKARRLERAVHGLDADQILLTDFFGLSSTRAPKKAKRLRGLGAQARSGDLDAAEELLSAMSTGDEKVPA